MLRLLRHLCTNNNDQKSCKRVFLPWLHIYANDNLTTANVLKRHSALPLTLKHKIHDLRTVTL